MAVRHGCPQFASLAEVSRRQAMVLGALTGSSLLLPDLLRAREQSQPNRGTFGRAKSVIMLYLHGGNPQQETWDPKPHGPSAVRGEFKAISTAVPDIHVSEVLPQAARILDRLTIIRSLSHTNPNHVQASLPAQTGHEHPPSEKRKGDFPPSNKDFPPVGAVIDHLRQRGASLPNWVRIGPLMRRSNGTVLHGQVPGFLGERHSPLVVDQDLLPEDVSIEAVRSQNDVPLLRLEARRDLLRQVNQAQSALDGAAATQPLDAYYARAFDMLCSGAVAKAFDLAGEPAQTRQRYGRTQFGQRCLLARRLAEAGVPMINVSYCHTPSGSWDTHGQNFKKMKDQLGPDLDMALTALVLDLEDRGMLDETLVVATAEFGRTPAINKNAGRDHWPWVYSVALAGAGLQPGVVYGGSDPSAAYPAEHPHHPRDLIATLYHLLGVPAETVLRDALGRPHHLVIGKPIEAILA